MDLGLADSVVLVTGGTGGLGDALVRGLLAEGARVAFCARRSDQVSARTAEFAAAGFDALGVVADVSVAGQVEEFVATAHRRWGRIDAYVSNAGTAAGGSFEANDDEYWRRDVDTKLLAAVRGARLVIPYLRAGGGGSILLTLATFGKSPAANTTPSSVVRAAGLGLVKALSKEFGIDNIRANAICVGFIDADQWQSAAQKRMTSVESLYASLAEDYAIPLGRVGTRQDFADLASFLLSRRASYISGAAINLDGGLSPVV